MFGSLEVHKERSSFKFQTQRVKPRMFEVEFFGQKFEGSDEKF